MFSRICSRYVVPLVVALAVSLPVSYALGADPSDVSHLRCYLRIDGSHMEEGMSLVYLYKEAPSSQNNQTQNQSTQGQQGQQDNSATKVISKVKEIYTKNDYKTEDKPFSFLDEVKKIFDGYQELKYFLVSHGAVYDIPVGDIGLDQPNMRHIGFVMWSYSPLNTQPLNVPSLQIFCSAGANPDDEDWQEESYVVFSGIEAVPTEIEGERGKKGTGSYAVVPLHPGLPPTNVWEQLNPRIPFQPYDLPGYSVVAGLVDVPELYDIPDNATNVASVEPMPGAIYTHFTGAVAQQLDEQSGEIKLLEEPIIIQGRLKALLTNDDTFLYILTGDYNTPMQIAGINFISDLLSKGAKSLSYEVEARARRYGYLGQLSLVREGDVDIINANPVEWEDFKCLILCEPKTIFTASSMMYVPTPENNGQGQGGSSQSGGR